MVDSIQGLRSFDERLSAFLSYAATRRPGGCLYSLVSTLRKSTRFAGIQKLLRVKAAE